MWHLQAAVPHRADGRPLLQPSPQQLRLPVNAGARAQHGLIALVDAPGEAYRRREVVVVVLGRAQIAAIQRRQVLRLVQIAVDQRAFEVPGEAVVECDTWLDLPGVLPVEAEPVV